ncbi:hypothetical protein IAD21_06277 [Abditibacteriota bacterium]|nr:hypothetical protein IAD21_06277 [Abditibacteriota bacterium]
MFKLFSRGKNKIENPAILLCTLGSASAFPQDTAIYQPYPNIAEFKANTLSELANFLSGKTFDIVHLFVEFADDGTIEGQAGMQLVELLTKADTKLAIFACDNSIEKYMAAFPAGQRQGVSNMHLVLTLDRNGENFFTFFKGIFELMAKGKSMPMAWVTLAPQHDGPWMEKMPGCVFEANRGQLKFVQ